MEVVLCAIKVISQLLMIEEGDVNKKIQIVIGLVPRIVFLLSGKFTASPEVKQAIVSEAAHILSNITAGDHEQTSSVVKADAIPLLVDYTIHRDSTVRLSVSFQVSF